jgi:chromosomal replication initiation ATPase DnaA
MENDKARALAWLRKRDFTEHLDRVCREHRVTVEEVYGRRRYPRAVAARRALVLALYEETGNVSEVGRLMGLDHTTVLHHLRAARDAEGPSVAKATGESAGEDLAEVAS